ncbi:hypothetical protein [Paraburkholderia sp. BR14320]|uniref:hypothetical protein n=1 Tax=unclassified Paraburkholderia TaxID=2615204 RepID=UPI0034CF0217
MRQTKNYIRRYLPLSAVFDTLLRKKLALLDPQNWDDKNDRRFMQLYKEAKHLNSLYALCAATCTETYAHWRVYSPAAEGACIEIWREPLEAALKETKYVRFRDMKYVKLEDVDHLGPADLEDLPFSKRVGYGSEREYRIIAWSKKPQAAALEIDIDLNWVKKIELNPWMPKSLADSVQTMLKAVPNCENLATSQSSLIDNQRWRDAGDRVLGRPPGGAETTLSPPKKSK